jgi:RNA polymerase sigma factor (sigma-70 family)
VEASALQAPAALSRPRLGVSGPLLKLRSDEQLVSLFRRGNEDAFRVIHDRYRARLFAYTRQMLAGSRQDAEDALQDVFVRAYRALRESDRELSLRAWLYRVAHNRCIDELRRPPLPPPEVLELVRPPEADPLAQTERRESLRRLVADVRRLPEHQRSALLMRELNGLGYAEIATALGVTVPAVKSLLVRARVGLAQAGEARDVACVEVQGALALAQDRGVRPGAVVRRHLSDCRDCSVYRGELRGISRNMAGLLPALGPVAALARLLGLGSAGSGAALGSGGAMSSGVAAAGAAKVAAVVAVAVVTAGGAVEVSRTLNQPAARHRAQHRTVHHAGPATPAAGPSSSAAGVSSALPAASEAAHPRGTGSAPASRRAHAPAPPATDPTPAAPTVDPATAGPGSTGSSGSDPGAGAASPAGAASGPADPTADSPAGAPSAPSGAPSGPAAEATSAPPPSPLGSGAP